MKTLNYSSLLDYSRNATRKRPEEDTIPWRRLALQTGRGRGSDRRRETEIRSAIEEHRTFARGEERSPRGDVDSCQWSNHGGGMVQGWKTYSSRTQVQDYLWLWIRRPRYSLRLSGRLWNLHVQGKERCWRGCYHLRHQRRLWVFK